MLQGEIDHSSKKDALNLLLWVIHIHTYTHMGTLIHIHNTLIYKHREHAMIGVWLG